MSVLPLWTVSIDVRPIVPAIALLDDDDRETPLLARGGIVRMSVAETDADAAGERALDLFHATVPIAVLDDFDIEVTVAAASRHATLAAAPLAPGVVSRDEPVLR